MELENQNQNVDQNAEENSADLETVGSEDQNNDDKKSKEDILSELSKLKMEKERTKLALDKALKEVGDLKKSLRQNMTAQEQEDAAKKEYVTMLEDFKRKTEAKERYLIQGMTVEMAEKAAEAEVSGDMDGLRDLQKQHTENTIKAEKAKWQKTIPQSQYGVGNDSSMTVEDIFKIKDYDERIAAINKNMNLFRKEGY